MDWEIPTVYPKPLCILFSDTKGIQWADTDATLENAVMHLNSK